MSKYKQMQVQLQINNLVQDLKSSLNLSSASEVIGYLYAIYDGHYPKLTVIEHQEALKKMKNVLNQDSLM